MDNEQLAAALVRHTNYVNLGLPCLVEDCPWCMEQDQYANRGMDLEEDLDGQESKADSKD